jgi:hypothetical protein
MWRFLGFGALGSGLGEWNYMSWWGIHTVEYRLYEYCRQDMEVYQVGFFPSSTEVFSVNASTNSVYISVSMWEMGILLFRKEGDILR